MLLLLLKNRQTQPAVFFILPGATATIEQRGAGVRPAEREPDTALNPVNLIRVMPAEGLCDTGICLDFPV
jgi:hypothetical protein